MRTRLSYLLVAVSLLGGCPTPQNCMTNPTMAGCIMVLDTNNRDGGVLPDTNPVDTGVGIDTNISCNSSGRVGSHCRTGMCASGSTCVDLTATAGTIQAAFGLQQGDLMDPAHTGYQRVQMPQVATDSAPFNAAEGTLCAQQCDTTATTSTCGACTSCSGTMTQMPLIAAFGGVRTLYGRMAMFGTSTGVCRLNCTWDHATRGNECPDNAMTCDAFSSTCIEACTTNNECNTAYGVTYSGSLVTILAAATDHPETCNMTTGRCESDGTAGATVGTHCTSNHDCAAGTGICLNGGHCAEFGCPMAGTATGTCGTAAAGVCLPVNNAPHPNSLCLLGCDTATDCGAGNVCNLFAGGRMIGTHHGYCIGGCATDDQCNNSATLSETCTDYTTTDPMGATTSHNGRCVHRCGGTGAPVVVGAVGHSTGTAAAYLDCLTTEWCQTDHVGANYGHCSPLNGFCGPGDTRSLPAQQADCATGLVCDETLATPHGAPTPTAPAGPVSHEDFGDGHCVARCATAADCTGGTHQTGEVCIPQDVLCTAHADMATCAADATHHCNWFAPNGGTGSCGAALAGLCRVPCTAAAPTCPTDQVCDATQGYCVEVAPPMP